MHATARAVSLLVLAASMLGVPSARAETVNCSPITAVPVVIAVQGIYCFTAHLETALASGAAVDIQVNNVVLDLNGFKLGNLSAGPGTSAVGIRAGNRQNITVKNGTIRGFFTGIELSSIGASQGHVVEDIRADQNRGFGIDATGSGIIVRNNRVVATGGSTILIDAVGIRILGGAGNRVLNNDVIHTIKQGSGTATGILFGLAVTGALAVNNRISEADRGIEYFTGLPSSSTGKYRDNLTFDVPMPYLGGTDAGNNN